MCIIIIIIIIIIALHLCSKFYSIWNQREFTDNISWVAENHTFN